MTADTSTLRSALIWAASGHGAFPGFDSIDADDFYEALQQHRLDGRLIGRLRDSPGLMPREWQAAVQDRHRQTLEHIEKQRELYSSIRSALRQADPAQELIPLKGFDLYALSGRPDHARYSVDIDILGRDPAAVTEAAREMVTSQIHDREHPHEYAVFACGPEGQIVEVHRQYNITGFRAGAQAAGFTPGAMPGQWELAERFSIFSLYYPDLAGWLTTGHVHGRTVPVLRPEAAMIVRCAHLYVGYLINLFPLPVATVRLDELAALADLAALRSFDARRFSALCTEFKAQFVVEFGRRLSVDVLGTDPLAAHATPSLTPAGHEAWFPRNLWWDGIAEGLPVNLGWSPGDLVARAADHPDVTEQLGRTVLRLGSARRARVTMLRADPDELGRYFYRRRTGADFDVILDITARFDGLDVAASLPAAPADERSAMAISSGDWRYELFCQPGEGYAEFDDYSVDPRYGRDGGGGCSREGVRDRLRITLPWRALGRSGPPGRGEEMPLLFRARRQKRHWGPITGTVIAPMALAGEGP